jgi:flagellar protein FliS
VNKAAEYQKMNVESVVDSASPHQLINMLFEGACARLQKAQGCIAHGDIQGRSEAITATVSIISGLQASLDHERGGDLAENLESLYDYIQRRLFRANSDNDPRALDEVVDLIKTLHDAWSAIRQDVALAQHA